MTCAQIAAVEDVAVRAAGVPVVAFALGQFGNEKALGLGGEDMVVRRIVDLVPHAKMRQRREEVRF
ncbi:MAG: hypothetical protein RBU21_23040, partial [FCB group bacterium]|nr:hypothetical protein [FCB group bacterium]